MESLRTSPWSRDYPRTDFKLWSRLGLEGHVLGLEGHVLGLALVLSASPWQVSKAVKAYNYEYIVNFGVNE